MADRLLVDLDGDEQAKVQYWPDGGIPELVSRARLAWPLDPDALDDLRWYLEDYLLAPFGVWEDRGPAVQAKLAGWGEQVFGAVFNSSRARDAYRRARDAGLELVFRSADPGPLGLPWELMRDDAGPVALGAGGISRSLPVADVAGTIEVPDGRLRVLMVISRPAGIRDIGYQMVARPLLARLEAVRGEVDFTVLRPPTFDALYETVKRAADNGVPFHIVHFDGHGLMPGAGGGPIIKGRPAMMAQPGEGVLAFEKYGGADYVGASKVAAVLAQGQVPVVVLNACQSGAMGKALEASVATALLTAGCAAVVAMAYRVNAAAAAEFMAAFYEDLFTGARIGQAVTAGRKRLFERDQRPSRRGDLPLADWLVPVHYLRKEVSFSQISTGRPADVLTMGAALDQIWATEPAPEANADPLAAVDGVFVGRDDLIYQLESGARLQQVVILTGPGGTGKTELAKGFARWWRDTRGLADPRLVFWHSFELGLTSCGLDRVITGIGLEVFGADFARQDAAERLAQVKRLLAQDRALLVWDSFETVREMPDLAGHVPPLDEAGCAELREFLEWTRDHSQSAVIITSRAQEDWLGRACRIDVGGLSQVEAAQYADHLLAPFPAAQALRRHRSFGELLDWLDGHPLAMRLTLPRLDTTDPVELLAGLQGTTPLTPQEDAGPDRLSSLGGCITYSIAHLAEATRLLLPAVSLCRGVTDANLLMAFSHAKGAPVRFAGVHKPQWTEMLEDAARVGLLTRLGTAMYHIHPALPGYLAAGRHAEDAVSYDLEREACEQALCSACAEYSGWLTGQFASGVAALAYAVTGLHRRTLTAMLGYALDHRRWAEAENIVRALDTYWDARGLGGEAATWASRILTATAGPSRTLPRSAWSLWLYTTNHQANRQRGAGQPGEAARAYQQALGYLHDQPETGWTRGNVAVIYHQLGMAAQGEDRLDEADDWYRKALVLKEELGDRPGMASTYGALGTIAYDRWRLDEADEWYRKALVIFEELGDRHGIAVTGHHLGLTAEYRRRLDEAEEWYRRALAFEEELGDRPGMADSYHHLGTIEQRRERLGEATEWYRKALVIFEDLGDRPAMARAYHELGITAHEQGRLDEASDWHRKALTISEELGDRHGTARTYHELGMTAHEQGRLDKASDWHRKALVIFEELGDRHGMALTYAVFGAWAEERGQPHLAILWNTRCVSLFSQFPSSLTGGGPAALVRLTRQLGMIALDEAWQQVTGQPVPQAVRDHITSHHDEEPGDRP